MKQTFWAVQPSYESQLKKTQQQEIQDQRHKEDYFNWKKFEIKKELPPLEAKI